MADENRRRMIGAVSVEKWPSGFIRPPGCHLSRSLSTQSLQGAGQVGKDLDQAMHVRDLERSADVGLHADDDESLAARAELLAQADQSPHGHAAHETDVRHVKN